MSIKSKINLQDNEEIIRVVNPSFVSRWFSYFLSFLLLLSSAYFLSFLLSYGQLGQIGLIAAVVLALVIFTRAFVLQKGNALVITTARVIDISRLGLFSENVYILNFNEIKDAFVEKRGIKSWLFGIGNIVVESKNSEYEFNFQNVFSPQEIQNLILSKRQAFDEAGAMGLDDIYNSFLTAIPEFDDEELDVIADEINREIKTRANGNGEKE